MRNKQNISLSPYTSIKASLDPTTIFFDFSSPFRTRLIWLPPAFPSRWWPRASWHDTPVRWCPVNGPVPLEPQCLGWVRSPVGVSSNGGTPISHPKSWSFLVGKLMVVGETQHFRKQPYMSKQINSLLVAEGIRVPVLDCNILDHCIDRSILEGPIILPDRRMIPGKYFSRNCHRQYNKRWKASIMLDGFVKQTLMTTYSQPAL